MEDDEAIQNIAREAESKTDEMDVDEGVEKADMNDIAQEDEERVEAEEDDDAQPTCAQEGRTYGVVTDGTIPPWAVKLRFGLRTMCEEPAVNIDAVDECAIQFDVLIADYFHDEYLSYWYFSWSSGKP